MSHYDNEREAELNEEEWPRLMLGDCLDRMKEIESGSVAAVISDLPFGTTRCKWDTVIPFEPMWLQIKRIIKPNGVVLLNAQTPFDKALGASNLPMLKYEWIWEKTAATGHLNARKMPMKAHENILVFYNKRPTYNPQKTQGHKPVNSYTKQNNADGECYGNTVSVSGGGNTDRYPRSIQVFSSDKQKLKLHPTQKPVALMEYLAKTYTSKDDVIVDVAMGSGTMGVAAKNLNRKFIGIEMDEGYFNIAKKRIDEA
jgi:site-specific DNA-methyltransferase (adenine-specific)